MTQSQSQTQQTRDAAQFQLRLPDDLKTRIQDAAEISGRSLNSEIVVALIEKFMPAKLGAKAAMDLFAWIDAAQSDTECNDRIREAEFYLKQINSNASISQSRDGTITIEANPL